MRYSCLYTKAMESLSLVFSHSFELLYIHHFGHAQVVVVINSWLVSYNRCFQHSFERLLQCFKSIVHSLYLLHWLLLLNLFLFIDSIFCVKCRNNRFFSRSVMMITLHKAQFLSSATSCAVGSSLLRRFSSDALFAFYVVDDLFAGFASSCF